MESLTGGTWNTRVLRDPPTVARECSKLMRVHHLDFLLLQEVEGYRAALMGVPDCRYISRRIKTRNEWREVGVLVRDGVRVTGVLNTAVGDGWFGHIIHRWHPGRTFLRCTLDGWLRVATVHGPPGVNLTTRTPRDQWDDYTALMGAVRRFLLRPHRARLVAGDWNVPASNQQPGSPVSVAHQTGARVTGHGIDYAITKRCRVIRMTTDTTTPHGSDHDPVIMEVSQSP